MKRTITLVSLALIAAAIALSTTADAKRLPNTAGAGKKTLAAPTLKDGWDHTLLIPPRYMWGWGPGLRGYCGETSFQSHGIYYGNWLSSEEVRYSAGGTELLIGVNEVKAAKDLKFQYDEWNGVTSTSDEEEESIASLVADKLGKKKKRQSKDYSAAAWLPWMRNHIDNGHLVVTGLYEKVPSGDSEYDHIIPVIGYKQASGKVVLAEDVHRNKIAAALGGAIDTKHNAFKVYQKDILKAQEEMTKKESESLTSDSIDGIFFNDLYLNETRYISASSGITTRSGCKRSSWPNQPYDYCITQNRVYSTALTGILDDKKQSMRMAIVMPSWTEPDWGKEDALHEQTIVFNISALAMELTPGHDYRVVRFDDRESTPSSDFAKGSWSKSWTFTAGGTSHLLEGFDQVDSDGTFFYRCVEIQPSEKKQ